MTMTEPIADLQWGKGDWQDYVNNWRGKDALWMQQRSILRYHNAAQRDADWPTPSLGQVVYNEAAVEVAPGVFVDRPEMYSKQHGTWVPMLMLANITSTQDNTAGVALSHKLSGGKGVILGPGSPAGTGLLNVNAPMTVLNGTLAVDTSGVTVKTGAKPVKLTTDAASLISDSPLSVPSLTTTGTVTAATVSVPTISGVTSLTASNINMSGTLSGGALNGSSGTIGGVAMGTSGAHGSGGVRADAQGFHAQNGAFYGDGSSAWMRQRTPAGGAYGGAYVRVDSTNVTIEGGNYTFMNNQFLIRSGRPINWYRADNNFIGYSGPVIWGGDPGVGNVPEGTVWAF